jgi:hypothetical protein
VSDEENIHLASRSWSACWIICNRVGSIQQSE